MPLKQQDFQWLRPTTGTAISLQESGSGSIYLADTAGYYTLVFYPEDSGIVVHDLGAEGFYSYTTTKPKLLT